MKANLIQKKLTQMLYQLSSSAFAFIATDLPFSMQLTGTHANSRPSDSTDLACFLSFFWSQQSRSCFPGRCTILPKGLSFRFHQFDLVACLIPFYLLLGPPCRGGLASNLMNGRRGTGPTVRYSIQASKLGSYK